MEAELNKTKSIPELIVEETLTTIGKDANFDENAINNLILLIKNNELKKAEQVLKAITPASEDNT
jgi:hypothetical protein